MRQTEFARQLRQAMTPAEHLLWSALRNRRTGHKFRRQMPIGPYVADFACHEGRLIVEVDGGHHGEGSRDQERDAWLEERGWRVVRYGNGDVLDRLEAVVWDICERLGDPSPARRA